MTIRSIGCVFAIAAATLCCSACKTTEKPATTKEAKTQAADDEYVVIEPEIGSRVKKRVKKSELAEYLRRNPSAANRVKFDENTVIDDTGNRLTTGEMEKSVGNR